MAAVVSKEKTIKKGEKKAKTTKKSENYKIEGTKLTRTTKFCPRCGDGIFMAKHKDRYGCGKCGYTEFVVKK
ncbi:MAG: 30S ribosomal protein S27ae [Candidatus Altiarchaeales archaeon A3]|nr:MAG: 30S ribosomal protein S27ae [Candidatus Altiarchaeales archaeon A3]